MLWWEHKIKRYNILTENCKEQNVQHPNTVFQRQKCVNHCSENCSNHENIQSVNCNGLYRQMCSKSEPATTQGAAYMNFYCISYIDMLEDKKGN
jgi:hypothetical protein